MIETWRWYGPDLDKITLDQIRQTGAAGIVTALHEIPYGEVWSRAEIAARKGQVEAAGFTWEICESLPLHEDIKRGTGDLGMLFANYRQSLAHLAAEGVQVVCYNFMPILDWTRTDLAAPVAGGGTCLRFEAAHMAAFEVHMLEREGAEADYSEDVLARAKTWFESATEAARAQLLGTIMTGMPGAFDRYDIAGLRRVLQTYAGMTHDDLRANYQRFLDEVIPTAEELGMRLCVHPDDPPRDILGLPRIVSSAADIDWIMQANDASANGLTLCTGSLGAGADNDPVAIGRKHAERIHFAHLRNVRKDPDGSFEEDAHLGGDTDMVAVCRLLLEEEARRRAKGRADAAIPFRPDHGHELLSDQRAGTIAGYPLIGRLRGLAELRGVVAALS